MNHIELRNLLKNKIKELGKAPLILTIDNVNYNLSGGCRLGSQILYRYRESGIHEFPKEKEILI